MRSRSRRVTVIIVIVVALYILNILRIDDFLFTSSSTLFFFFPTSTSVLFLVFLAAVGIGGAVPIALGLQRLFGRREMGETPLEGPVVIAETQARSETANIAPSTEVTPEMNVDKVTSPVNLAPTVRMASASEEKTSRMEPSIPSTASTTESSSQKSGTLSSIYAKQKEYGQRVSELLRDLQFMANSIVQISPSLLRSTCMAAYLTSDAVVLMFDRDRTMTTKPLRDFPTEVIVAVVAECTPKLKKSVLEKKRVEMGKVHSLEDAVKELEEAKAEVNNET